MLKRKGPLSKQDTVCRATAKLQRQNYNNYCYCNRGTAVLSNVSLSEKRYQKTCMFILIGLPRWFRIFRGELQCRRHNHKYFSSIRFSPFRALYAINMKISNSVQTS